MVELARLPLPEVWRFIAGCRDLRMALLAADAAGLHVFCCGDVADIRRMMAAVTQKEPAARLARDPSVPPPAEHWRTCDRLDRTFAAVQQLLESLAERPDLSFVTAWSLAGDVHTMFEYSFDVSQQVALEQLALFHRRFLPGQPRCHEVTRGELGASS